MPLSSIADQSVIRLRGVAGQDDYGNDILDWSAPDELTISGCSVQPAPAAEYTDTREEVLTRWQLWAPVNADITHTDRIQSDGVTYIVDGSVQMWTQLGLAHRTCLLRQLEEG
jgi:hypothetical protein